MNKKRIITSLIINSIIAISAITVIIIGVFFSDTDRDLSVKGINYLRYFTNLSGLFAGISSLLVAISNIKELKGDIVKPSIVKLQLCASTAVMITFLTVVFFLAPMWIDKGGYFIMFKGDMFHMHFLNCLLEMIAFTFFQKYELKMKDILIGAIAVPIYSLAYIPLVLTKVWDDFYNFTFGGNLKIVPIVITIMYFISFLVSFLQVLVHNKIVKKYQAD